MASGQRTSSSISVVLPAYNEEAIIERTVRHVVEVLSGLASDFEVIVTNDGSRDRTGAVLADLQRGEPQLHLLVVTHEHNRGYGAAVASGFDAANKDLVFLTDGDKQFDVTELREFLRAREGQPARVMGWRRNGAAPPLRKANALGWKLLVNLLFGYTARDVDCAFKLFRRRVWQSMTVNSRGATFSAEFLIKARRLGFHVKEQPVTHFPRTAGSPTGARPAVIVRAFAELCGLRRNLDRDVRTDPCAQGAAGGSRDIAAV